MSLSRTTPLRFRTVEGKMVQIILWILNPNLTIRDTSFTPAELRHRPLYLFRRGCSIDHNIVYGASPA